MKWPLIEVSGVDRPIARRFHAEFLIDRWGVCLVSQGRTHRSLQQGSSNCSSLRASRPSSYYQSFCSRKVVFPQAHDRQTLRPPEKNRWLSCLRRQLSFQVHSQIGMLVRGRGTLDDGRSEGIRPRSRHRLLLRQTLRRGLIAVNAVEACSSRDLAAAPTARNTRRLVCVLPRPMRLAGQRETVHLGSFLAPDGTGGPCRIDHYHEIARSPLTFTFSLLNIPDVLRRLLIRVEVSHRRGVWSVSRQPALRPEMDVSCSAARRQCQHLLMVTWLGSALCRRRFPEETSRRCSPSGTACATDCGTTSGRCAPGFRRRVDG